MGDIANIINALAGTLGLDRGGDAAINSLFDVIVKVEKPAADGAAGDATNRNGWRNLLGYTVRLEEAQYVPDAALTAHDTNFATVNVLKGPSAGVTVNAAAKTTVIANGNWVADTPVVITPSGTEANRLIADDEIVALDIAKSGTGVVVPAGCLVLRFRRV